MQFQEPLFLLLLFAVPAVWFLPRRADDLRHAALRSAALAFVVLALARPIGVVGGGEERHVVVLDAAQDERASELAERLADEHGAARIDVTSAVTLSDALFAAHRALPADARGAVTVVSDGLATDRAWGAAAQAFAERGVPVHAVALDAPESVRPVRVVPLDVLRVGASGRVAVDVVGPRAIVDVVLRGPDGELDRVEGVRLDGRARAVLELEPAAAGFLAVDALVVTRSGADERADDDALATTLAVHDPLRALWIGGRVEGGAERLGELVGAGFRIEPWSPSDGDVRGALADHELVVLDDAPADSVPAGVQEELVRAVAERGVGLFASGGEGAFGPGGWHETPLASVLPTEALQKEEKRDPSTALVVIIDTSGSMGGNRVQLAKEVARLAIRRLLPHDKVGIVEFYGAKRWAAPLQPASNSIEIERALNRLDAGGGTVILPAIEEAFYGLKNVRTRYKHVLVLTDGGVETGAFEPLMRAMADDGINVSTVLIGPDAHSEFLVRLANWGKGRFYSVPNRFNLPEVLLKQPASAKLPAYRPGTHALTSRGGPGWWGSVDPADVPPLAGYVETRARPGAEVVLETASGAHPVLASWRFGLGRVTAFTTEPAGKGTAPWSSWDEYGAFLARVLARTAADATGPFAYSLEREGREIVVRAERRIASSAEPSAARVEPNAPLRFDARSPDVYEARFVCSPSDEVRVVAEGRVRLVSPVGDARAPEANVDPAGALDLRALAAATGGRWLAIGDAAGFAPSVGGAEDPAGVRRYWPLFLLVALFAYVGDVAWRRRAG